MSRMRRGALLAALLLAGCEAGGEPAEGVAEGGTGAPAEVPYAPELDVSIDEMTRLPSGVYYEDMGEGGGATAAPGDRVAVHYTGWLPDGTKFDSSRDRGQLFVFRVGAGEVIEGWDQGVTGMRVGGRRKLVIPPELAYGQEGAGGVIPPNSTLVFDVELVEIE